MPRRSSLNVPLAEHNGTHRRSRSVDDRPNASICTPANTKPFEPGTSWSHPIALYSDEDGDNHNATPTIKTPRKAKARDGAARPGPSTVKHTYLQPPTTPDRTRPRVHRKPVSDPGPRPRVNQDEIYERVVAYQHLDRLPCGRKQYTHPLGTWAQGHQAECTPCIERQGKHRELYDEETQQPADGRDLVTPNRSTRTETYHDGDDDNDDDDNNSDIVVDCQDNNDGNERSPKAVRENCDQVASMVHHRLIQAAKEKLTGDEKAGYLYILRDSKDPGLLKLGYSVHVHKRGKQHKHACGLELAWVTITGRVKNMKRAEKLAKLDMVHLRADWSCSPCNRKHTEWFRVDEEKAKAVVVKWVTWINEQDPYNEDGDLDPIWGWLMEDRRKPRSDFGENDHQARWTHWDRVLSLPSGAARAKYEKLCAANPQQEREKTTLAYRQRTSKGQYDNILGHRPTIVEQTVNKINVFVANEFHFHGKIFE